MNIFCKEPESHISGSMSHIRSLLHILCFSSNPLKMYKLSWLSGGTKAARCVSPRTPSLNQFAAFSQVSLRGTKEFFLFAPHSRSHSSPDVSKRASSWDKHRDEVAKR